MAPTHAAGATRAGGSAGQPPTLQVQTGQHPTLQIQKTVPGHMRGLAAYVLARGAKVPNGVPNWQPNSQSPCLGGRRFPASCDANPRRGHRDFKSARNWPHELRRLSSDGAVTVRRAFRRRTGVAVLLRGGPLDLLLPAPAHERLLVLGDLCPQGVEGVASVHVAEDQFAIDADHDFVPVVPRLQRGRRHTRPLRQSPQHLFRRAGRSGARAADAQFADPTPGAANKTSPRQSWRLWCAL